MSHRIDRRTVSDEIENPGRALLNSSASPSNNGGFDIAFHRKGLHASCGPAFGGTNWAEATMRGSVTAARMQNGNKIAVRPSTMFIHINCPDTNFYSMFTGRMGCVTHIFPPAMALRK